jgi:hypothetical protein
MSKRYKVKFLPFQTSVPFLESKIVNLIHIISEIFYAYKKQMWVRRLYILYSYLYNILAICGECQNPQMLKFL